MKSVLRRCVPLTTFLLTASLLIPSFVLASGVTWTNQTTATAASGQAWFSISSSADGDTLAAVDAPNDSIWLSTDSGQTQVDQNIVGQGLWYGVTMSADASLAAAVDDGGDIWTATLSFPAPPAPTPEPAVVSSGGGWSGGCSTYPRSPSDAR